MQAPYMPHSANLRKWEQLTPDCVSPFLPPHRRTTLTRRWPTVPVRRQPSSVASKPTKALWEWAQLLCEPSVTPPRATRSPPSSNGPKTQVGPKSCKRRGWVSYDADIIHDPLNYLGWIDIPFTSNAFQCSCRVFQFSSSLITVAAAAAALLLKAVALKCSWTEDGVLLLFLLWINQRFILWAKVLLRVLTRMTRIISMQFFWNSQSNGSPVSSLQLFDQILCPAISAGLHKVPGWILSRWTN